MRHEAKTGSLRQNFDMFMGMCEAQTLSRDAFESFRQVMGRQIDAADRLALDTPVQGEGAGDAATVLGSTQARPVYPTPRPVQRPAPCPVSLSDDDKVVALYPISKPTPPTPNTPA